MATITKPMALDESFNTTEETPRSQADVLAAIESAIRQGFGQVASGVEYDNTDSGLTADNVQDAIDEVNGTVDGIADDVTEILSDIESTQTVSGNPLTLTDAAPINAESLVVELEPKQDLHGYQYPWVGGAGKNKLRIDTIGYSYNGITFTVVNDDAGNVLYIDADGTATAQSLFPINTQKLSLTENVILNGCSGGSAATYGIRLVNEPETAVFALCLDGDTSLPAGNYGHLQIFIEQGTSVNHVKFYPMIRLSNVSDSSYESWSNICPISGYTQTSVEGTGINVWDEEWAVGYWDQNNGNFVPYGGFVACKNKVPVYPNTTYHTRTPNIEFDICSYDANGNFLRFSIMQGNDNIVTASDEYFIAFNSRYVGEMTTYNHNDIIISPASTSATIQFGQTVYGGRSNFTDGGTDVIYGYDADLGAAGRPWWKEEDSGGVFRTELPLSKYMGILYCSMYKGVQKNWPDDGEICVTNTQAYQLLRIKDPACAGYTAAEFATYISGCQLAYELAEPTQLSTPPTDLKLLQGTNNLSADGVMQIGYQPDNVIGEVKGEIEKCAVDAEFMQFTDGTDTFTDVNLSLDASLHTVSVVGAKIEQKRFMCFEVMDKMGGVLQGILASCIAFTDGAKTPSGTAFRAYIESLQMYVNFRIYGSGGSYTLAYQSESSFSASAFYVRVRMMNNL